MSARHDHAAEARRDVFTIFREAALRSFRARPRIRPWAEGLGVLVPSEANRMFAGRPYTFDKFPAISSLIFGFFEGDAREMVLMKDTQGAASTSAFWSMAWLLAWDPGNIIYIGKGRDAVKNTGADRMKHIFEGVPELRRAKKDGIGNSTAMAWRFPGGALFLGGCDSATSLIAQPASRVVLDEIKEHPFIDGKSTMDMARMRVKQDAGGKIFGFSTAGDAVEYVEDPRTGKKTPIATPESTPHLEWLTGTQEECEVPCPHCGFYQALDFERLRFAHCKESLDGLPAVWNRHRVVQETWYQCANPECTDRNTDGTVRGRIEEHHKPAMLAAHQWTPRNNNPHPGRRSASISVLYNISVPTSSWGHTALAFLDAQEKGTAEALKAFQTDYLGKPWEPRRITSASLARVVSLKRGYRRMTGDQQLAHIIPFPTEETSFVGGLVDVQSDHLKWLVHAAARDGRSAVLDWGISQFVENIPDIFRERFWTCRGEQDPDIGFGVVSVWMDVNGTKRSELYRHLLDWSISFPRIRWEGVAGRDKNQTRQVKIAAWERINYPVRDEMRRPIMSTDGFPLVVPVHNIDADYWEGVLYGDCIEAFDARALRAEFEAQGLSPHEAEQQMLRSQRLLLPGDAPESFLRELCNMKQVLKPVGHAGHKEFKWVKINQGPNDYGDLCKYAQVQIHAAREEGW